MGKLYLCLLLALSLTTTSTQADNWPNWRGPTFNQVAEQGDYPTTLDPAKNAVWKVDLPGRGSSTPCVWGDKIFITCDIGGQDGILCYDLNGQELWRNTLGKQRPGKHKNASGSNPTPVTNGEQVFVYYKSGTVAAFDFSGEQQWKLNLQEKYGEDTLWWDLGTSPILAGDNIVIAVMQAGESYLVALDQKTGKVAWRTLRTYKTERESDQAYTTPLVAEIDGQQQIVTWGADHLTGHSLDGELIWTCGGFNPENKPMWRVIASHGISNGYAVVPYGRADFLAFVKLGGKGDITKTAHVGLVGPKVGADVPSPIAVDGKAYVLTDAKGKTNGQVMCYDITTGKPLWDKPFSLPRAAGSYYSSPVKAGDLFYFSHEKGVIHVARETETGLELVATNEMPERQIATVVPINNHILLRSEKSLHYFKKLDTAAAIDR
eukprot:g13377.t1